MMRNASPTDRAAPFRMGERLHGFWLLLAIAAAVGACNEPHERSELESTVDYHLQTSPEERNTEKKLLRELETGADDRIRAALAGDALVPEVADRLVAAHENGVEVEVVADADDRDTYAARKLVENDVPVTFGDGSLNYLPAPQFSSLLSGCRRERARRRVVCGEMVTGDNPCGGSAGSTRNTMCRPGSYNRMTHRFILLDDETVWVLAGGLRSSDGGPMAWRAESEILHEDFSREFRQMAGGTFSTTLDAYNGPLKSTTDNNIEYTTDAGVIEVRFNPQERLLKHVIDEVYRARNSVAITTPVLRNPFLLDALEYKDENGFDVQLTVGDAQPKGTARQRLRGLNARRVSGDRKLPTIVVVDGTRLTADGDRQWPRTGLVLSHPLWHSQPYILPSNSKANVYPSDHFTDGTLWKFFEYSTNAGGTNETGQLDRLEQFVDETFSRGDSL